MKSIRENIALRFLWLFMALNIINCSVDSPDQQPDSIPEDLSYNDMESVVEIVLEKVLDYKDAIAEQDEQDEDSGSLTLKKEIDFSIPSSLLKVSFASVFNSHKSNHVLYKEKYSEQFHPELIPPPPKA